MLEPGDKAPDFTLEGEHGKVTLSKLLKSAPARTVVLYFYPKDKTPGCTREGQAFSAATKAFEKAGAVVYGVSKDSVKTHASFAETCGISVPLLSDPDLTVHRAYGAYGEKMMYGKKILGTIRSTFVIAPDGKLTGIFRSVKVDGHADAVLDAVTGVKTPAKPKASAKKPASPKAHKGASAKSSR